MMGHKRWPSGFVLSRPRENFARIGTQEVAQKKNGAKGGGAVCEEIGSKSAIYAAEVGGILVLAA